MNTIKLSIYLVIAVGLMLGSTNLVAEEKPVEHLALPDVTSLQEAKQVFSETTAELQTKTNLDAVELNDIHIITYSLEKALGYFAENMMGEQQTTAQQMAELVEQVHIGSENNRMLETAVYLEQYLKVAKLFSEDL